MLYHNQGGGGLASATSVNGPFSASGTADVLEQTSGRDRFRDYLESNGLKLTAQRQRILRAFMRQQGPMSAEDILAAAGGAESGISLSTLYRALNHLQCAGLARRIQLGAGSALYEAVHGHCCQLVCENCGRRIPVSNPYLESMREVAARQEGFELHHCSAQFYGLCPACQQARDAAKHREKPSARQSGF